MNLYLRVLSYVKPYKLNVVFSLLSSIFFVVFNAISIWMVSTLISTIMDSPKIAKLENSSLNFNDKLEQLTYQLIGTGTQLEKLQNLCIILILCYLLKNIFFYINNVLLSYVQYNMIMDIRTETFTHLHNLPLSFFNKNKIGNISSIVIRDIASMRTAFTQTIQKLINEPINIIVFLVLLFIINIKLTLYVFIMVPISAFIITKLGQSIRRKAKRSSIQIAGITNILHETLSGIKIVKSFGMEKSEVSKFIKESIHYFNLTFRQAKLRHLITPVNDMIGVFLGALLLWFGGYEVIVTRSMDADSFIRYIIYLFAMLQPARKLGNVNAIIQTGLASAERVFNIIDKTPDIVNSKSPKSLENFKKYIQFENVSFQYGNTEKMALNNINIKIPKGKVLALVGMSGSGKSTFADLIPRFYDTTNGSITIDQINIKNIDLKYLRNLMGIVSQDTFLFNDTISNNISYGVQNASFDKIKTAAENANALEFIKKLPQKFNTIIGEKGSRLSGGQRQRISIARALLKNPQILILDEATSALDSDSERKVQTAIDKLVQNRTVIVIAHRLSTIINADNIVVLNDGKIIESGSHDELLKINGAYKQLCQNQFNNEK